MRFFAHFPPCRAARLNQRVQLACAIAKQLHRQRIALSARLHVVQRVDSVPKYVFRSAHVAVEVLDGHTQLNEILVCCATAVSEAFRHVLGQVFHAVADTLDGRVDEIAGVAPFLQPLGADARLHGQRCHIVRIGARALRHVKGCFQRSRSRSTHGSHGRRCCLASGHQRPARRAASALKRFLQLAVLLLRVVSFAALALDCIPGFVRSVRQLAAGVGLRLGLGGQVAHAALCGFAGALHVVQRALRRADFAAHLVHGSGRPVQRDFQVVGLLGVLAILLLRFFQLRGNQLNLLLMRGIDSLQALQLAPHGLHAVRLPGEGALAGSHVRVQHGQLPGDVGQRGLVLFVA